METRRRFLTKWAPLYALCLIAGVGLGLGVYFSTVPKPKIGLIKMSDVVIFRDSLVAVAEMLDYAADHDSIKAVVIELDSPGGGVTESEELYLRTAQLRQKKPVVISVGSLAASGGYMMLLGGNYVYAKESSLVGNIGVIAQTGRAGLPPEDLLTTGPYKESGFPDRGFVEAIELLKESFAGKVVVERAGRLTLSREELADGRIHLGIQALRYGLIDDIGTTSDAIAKAAQLAGVKRYALLDVNKATDNERLPSPFFFFKYDGPPEPYTRLFYLYVEPRQ